MPRLWNDTIEAHRREVRDAILDAAATLVAEHGLRSVTMLQIAESAGIGRATLYKYFPDVEAILVAWHGRHVEAHLAHLGAARDRATTPDGRLDAVLSAYALIAFERRRHGAELGALLHRDQPVAEARRRLHELIRDAVAGAAAAGTVRTDVTPDELATYCRHALGAAGHLPSKAAVTRLVRVTRAGLSSPR